MALYNDKYWLLSHIRNSFISTDDTGMCEIVMEGQNLPKHLVDQLNTYPDSDESQDDEDFNQNDSVEIPPDLDMPARHRVPTSERDLTKKRAAKTKHIKWETPAVSEFKPTKKDPVTGPDVVLKSLLSQQIIKCTKLPQNPYIEYAKFDGVAQVGIPIRKYRIFLTMLPDEQRNYPMFVVCIATAKIEELIGLICFKCSTVHGDFPLKPVNMYGLYIMDEDGEVERDFPALDPRECVAKFGFSCLGLVEEHKTANVTSPDSAGDSATAATVEPAIQIVNSQEETKQHIEALTLLNDHANAMEALLYKSFKVYIIYKLRAKVEIHLGITGDKIEIDPVRQKSTKFIFSRHKPVSHSMDSIAACDIIDNKSSKWTFRIIYSPGYNHTSFGIELPTTSFHSSSSFKHYDFEADSTTTEDVVQKISMILEIRSSASRKEYLELKKNQLSKNSITKTNNKW